MQELPNLVGSPKIKKVWNDAKMNGYQYILTKQAEWAKNKGIDLIDFVHYDYIRYFKERYL